MLQLPRHWSAYRSRVGVLPLHHLCFRFFSFPLLLSFTYLIVFISPAADFLAFALPIVSLPCWGRVEGGNKWLCECLAVGWGQSTMLGYHQSPDSA